MSRTYLTFILYGELYAVQVTKVLEVLEKQEITIVPNAPPVVKGVLNFRGNVVPVYETSLALNLDKTNDESKYFIMILELSSDNGSFIVGAIVDKVQEVISLSDDEIKNVPPMNREYNSELITGITRIKNDFIMIMDVNKIFANKESDNIVVV